MTSPASSARSAGPASSEPTETELAVGGMTCASCAARVERRLNRMDGVTAAVNFATGKAKVSYDGAQACPDDLVEAVEATGYTAHPPDSGTGGDQKEGADQDAREAATLRRRLFVSLALAVPVAVAAMVPPLAFPGWGWVSLVLTTPVVFWGGQDFHRAAWANLRHGSTTMDTLISMGTLAAWAWSVWALLSGGHIYLEVAAVVTLFILTGRYFEARARSRAGSALRALLRLGAKEATLLDEAGSEQRVPAEQLRVGDRFVVRPGEQIATDGVVEEGSSAVDASVLTGESVPSEVEPEYEVAGATINVGGRLVVRATRVGSDTAVAQIARLVEEAQQGKAPVQRLADRISAFFVPAVIGLAVATLLAWLLFGGSVTHAFTAAVAVLIIACPCALGLATPTALLVGSSRGSQLGLLIRGPHVLESTRTVGDIVLDKTGTVTTGEMELRELTVAGGAAEEGEEEVLRRVGAVEHASEHPVAQAIARAAGERAGALPDAGDFAATQGLGVAGTVGDVRVVAGRPALLDQYGMTVPDELDHARQRYQEAGMTAVLAGWNGRARAVFGVGDTPKASSAAAIAGLRELGLRPMLVTGDNAITAAAVAESVGVAAGDVTAEVLPEDKVAVVRKLQDEGGTVAMVGDGVNDAAALAQADLGISIGTGTDIAIEASDLTLVRGDLTAAVDALRLSRRTLATIKGNLFWAFAYNVAAIPLAASGYLNPMVAGAAMAFSSVFVVTNSLRLRRFRTVS